MDEKRKKEFEDIVARGEGAFSFWQIKAWKELAPETYKRWKEKFLNEGGETNAD